MPRKNKGKTPKKKGKQAAAAPKMQQSQHVSSSSRAGLEEKVVRNAVAALLKHVENVKATQPMQLVEDAEYIHLIIGLRRIPDKGRNKPRRIPIPHSLFSKDEPNLCLFVKDPSAPIQDKLEETPVEGFNKVLSYSKLRDNYGRYKQRRELCASYDAFYSDERIIPMMPRLLGKVFFTKKKHPIPVCLSREGSIAHNLAKARDSTFLYLGWGPCTAVKVGRTNFSAAEVTENILAAMPTIIEHIKKGWKSVQAIHLKTTTSVALPIFNSLPELHGADAEHLPRVPRERAETDNGASAGAGAGAGEGGDGSDSDDSAIFSDEMDAPVTPAAQPKRKTRAKTTGGKLKNKLRKKKKQAPRFFDSESTPAATKKKSSKKASLTNPRPAKKQRRRSTKQ